MAADHIDILGELLAQIQNEEEETSDMTTDDTDREEQRKAVEKQLDEATDEQLRAAIKENVAWSDVLKARLAKRTQAAAGPDVSTMTDAEFSAYRRKLKV
jgi:uncharacterized membrane protein YukC